MTEDQIDHLGHMNVRFYGVNAHAATANVLAGLEGWPDGPHLVHDIYTRHHREQLLGTPLLVRSAFLGAGEDGITLHHELAPANAEALAAVFVHRVSPAGDDGRRRPVPAEVVEAIRPKVVQRPAYAASRSIDLALDPLAGAPSLELLRQRKLEMRKPRVLTGDECDDAGRLLPNMTLLLLWAGEPPEGAPSWGPGLYEAPGGELMGWAVMETRLQLARIPAAGTRIQSFSATIALHERAVHRIHWCFDLDRGEVLCLLEGVDVAFDTRSRKTMVIPDELRRRHAATLFEDLASPPRT